MTSLQRRARQERTMRRLDHLHAEHPEMRLYTAALLDLLADFDGDLLDAVRATRPAEDRRQ